MSAARTAASQTKESKWMKKNVDDTLSSPGRYGRQKSESESARGVAALGQCSAASLADPILAILRAGDAIAIGTTRDGGAIAITTFSGGMAEKFYASSETEIADLLAMLERAAG